MFLLDETHPSSGCSRFASQPAKPPQRKESRQWERIKMLMLSTASVKKMGFLVHFFVLGSQISIGSHCTRSALVLG